MGFKPDYFGKYVLLDKIAMGGMAEVYRARAPGAEGIGKIIALKRILPQFTSNTDFIDMFKSEASIAVNLTQGNIAQIFEFGEQDKQFYLAMEFIDGRNLRQILSRCSKLQKSLTIEQCVYIMAQVANGLDYAHRCTNKNTGATLNIIHRDMSPQNIMISFEGEVKIVDFGIAKAESKIENTRAGTLKGKFGYMSPEQAEGLELDTRTDIFSTGIILWELLSGERLFVANNEVNTIRKIKECLIPSLKKINPNIHDELERITSKALAKDRSLRYQTAAELYRDLSRFLYKINPEFTQHELSIFIKSLFKEDILEDRKKLTEFAKISFPNRENIQQETTRTETETSQFGQILKGLSKTQASQNEAEQTLSTQRVDLPIKVSRVEIARKSIPKPSGTPSHSASRHRPHSGGSYRSNTALMRRRKFLSRNMPTVLTIGALLLLAIYVYQHLDVFFPQFQTTDLSSKSPELSNLPAPPAAVLGRIFIRSIPAGAQIDINGTSLGNTTTPAEVQIPLNQVVNISLKREGYLPYTKELLATQNAEDFVATLQKAYYGYLDVYVQPPSADIYINGQKLAEKSPISKYPVPAGMPITIRAVNPYSQTSQQSTVTVKQDTVRKVELFLKKTK